MTAQNRISRYFSLILAAGAATSGCRTPTQITVEVTTDVPCDGSATKANTTIAVGNLGDALDSKPPVVVTSECKRVDAKTWRIGSLVVVPSGDKSAELGVRVVTGIGRDASECTQSDAKNCIIARRALRFLPHTELYLPIGLDADCTNVACGPTTTCVSGRCVSATIDDSSKCSTPNACDQSALPKPGGGGDAGVDAGGDASPAVGWAKIADASDGRLHHGAVWADKEMIVVGGQLRSGSGYTNTGESYDPKTNTWHPIKPAPLSGRRFFAMHWTGSEVIVWGGEGGLVDGARYDPATDSWKNMSAAPLSGRDDFVSVYARSRDELIVWGGGLETTTFADGARYSLATDTWTKLADPAAAGVRGRSEAGAVWDGTRMFIYGGFCPTFCDDTAAYDPAGTGTWTSLGATPVDKRGDLYDLLTGTAAKPIPTFFGGGQFSAPDGHTDGAWWDGGKWIAIPEAPSSVLPDPARAWPTVWAAGDRIHAWGGYTSGKLHADGAVYDRAAGTWSAMPPSPLSPRSHATAVWTGTRAILFGGDQELAGPVELELADGAIFTP